MMMANGASNWPTRDLPILKPPKVPRSPLVTRCTTNLNLHRTPEVAALSANLGWPRGADHHYGRVTSAVAPRAAGMRLGNLAQLTGLVPLITEIAPPWPLERFRRL